MHFALHEIGEGVVLRTAELTVAVLAELRPTDELLTRPSCDVECVGEAALVTLREGANVTLAQWGEAEDAAWEK